MEGLTLFFLRFDGYLGTCNMTQKAVGGSEDHPNPDVMSLQKPCMGPLKGRPQFI